MSEIIRIFFLHILEFTVDQMITLIIIEKINLFFQFISSRYSLISRGNVERLEVVNKKWVRVIPVPGTAMTTVSFRRYLLFGELFINLICLLFFFFILQRTIWFNIGSVDSLERNLENAQLDMGIEPANFVSVYYKNEFEPEHLSGVVPTLLIIGFTVYMFRKGASSLGGKGGGGFFGVGQSTAKLVNPSEIDVRFKYVFLICLHKNIPNY